MSKHKRTLSGPAHDPVALFQLDDDGAILPPRQHDVLAMHAALRRASDACQGVAATARRVCGEDAGVRVEWHFASLRDRVHALWLTFDDFVFIGGPERPDGMQALALLGLVQRDLDHYRTHRTAPGTV
jgi:hypothetical protein